MSVAAIVWLVFAIILVVVEAMTVQMISVWFAAACLCSVLVALLGLPLWMQFLSFSVISLILLTATRPLVRKLQNAPLVRTNADRLIGETAIVLSDIGNGVVGEVKVGGLVWSAVPESDVAIGAGELVRVRQINGVKLVVEKIVVEV